MLVMQAALLVQVLLRCMRLKCAVGQCCSPLVCIHSRLALTAAACCTACCLSRWTAQLPVALCTAYCSTCIINLRLCTRNLPVLSRSLKACSIHALQGVLLSPCSAVACTIPGLVLFPCAPLNVTEHLLALVLNRNRPLERG